MMSRAYRFPVGLLGEVSLPSVDLFSSELVTDLWDEEFGQKGKRRECGGG